MPLTPTAITVPKERSSVARGRELSVAQVPTDGVDDGGVVGVGVGVHASERAPTKRPPYAPGLTDDRASSRAADASPGGKGSPTAWEDDLRTGCHRPWSASSVGAPKRGSTRRSGGGQSSDGGLLAQALIRSRSPDRLCAWWSSAVSRQFSDMTALGRQLRCVSDPAEDHGTTIAASMCRQFSTVCLIESPTRQHRAIAGLPPRLATLPDPRDRRGRRHPFMSLLLVAWSAVTAGARSFTAIGQWARNAPQDTLARLGTWTTSAFQVRAAPSTATTPVVWVWDNLNVHLVDDHGGPRTPTSASTRRGRG